MQHPKTVNRRELTTLSKEKQPRCHSNLDRALKTESRRERVAEKCYQCQLHNHLQKFAFQQHQHLARHPQWHINSARLSELIDCKCRVLHPTHRLKRTPHKRICVRATAEPAQVAVKDRIHLASGKQRIF